MNSLLLRNQKPIIGLNNYYYCTNRCNNFSSTVMSFTKVSKITNIASPMSSTIYPIIDKRKFNLFSVYNFRTFSNDCRNPKISHCCNHILYTNISHYSVINNRYLSTSAVSYDQPSSKVEVTVKTIKQKEKEKVKQQTTSSTVADDAVPSLSTPAASSPDVITPIPPVAQSTKVASTTKTPEVTVISVDKPAEKAVVKKSLKQRIWSELVHYYHGFRLLFIDMNVARKLIWRIMMGKTLTRRENRLLVRTSGDVFRLVPFSVFIIVPFMEFLLPVAIKLFPGMLPSTFQTSTDRDDKMRQHLKVKLEMAKFLQKTLDDMAVQHKDHRSEAAKEFNDFFKNVKTTDKFSTEDIIKFSKLFEDEITLDSLSRQQLTALCRVLEVNTIGTTNFLRFQLRMKMRNLAADDRIIFKEGIDSLNLSELQSACRARGMRAYGASEDKLKSQLTEWINLSLNEKVPNTLLLLSRALMLPDSVTTSEKLKATISILPDTVGTQTKAAIGEREGKIDNKTKIEIIKEEQRKIMEERAEEREVAAEKAKLDQFEKEQEKDFVDVAPIIKADKLDLPVAKDVTKASVAERDLSSEDVKDLGEALGSISKTKKLIVEKEEIKDLKEEIAEYQEDVQELQEVVESSKESDIKESRAAKLLFKKVNSMINKLDIVLTDLETQEGKLKRQVEEFKEGTPIVQLENKKDELVHIDDLMLAIKKIQKVEDSTRLDQISKILGKIDDDQDGHIKVEDVLKVIETIGKENINLNSKQVDELVALLDKEEILEAEHKIEKALSKSLEAKEKIQKEKELQKQKEEAIEKQKTDLATEEILLNAAEKEKEKILPIKDSTASIPVPQIPTSTKKKNDKTL